MSSASTRWTPVPDAFFSRDLPVMTSAAQIKVYLHLLWRQHRRGRGTLPARRLIDVMGDASLRRGLIAAGIDEVEIDDSIRTAVRDLVSLGLVLEVVAEGRGREVRWLFVNTPVGARAHGKVLDGKVQLPDDGADPAPDYAPADGEAGANIFTLYEENVGPVTPLLADELKEAEAIYPRLWVEDAFRISVERNVRKWSYIRAILERWQLQGRADEVDRERGESSRSRYLEGKYGDYVEH